MRNLTATICLTIALLFTSAIIGDMSAAESIQKTKIPIWGNHQSTITGDSGKSTLTIRYSEDGKSFSVVWEYFGSFGKGTCSGGVDELGNLETVDCTPLGAIFPRSIGGTVFKIELLEYFGHAWAGPWHDVFLKQKIAEPERQRKAKLERQRKAELERKRKQAELERQRKVELERQPKAELERQRMIEVSLDLSKSPNAKVYLDDVREFVSLNPKDLDPLLLAQTYMPAMQEVQDRSFNKKGSRFLRLVAYTQSSARFRVFLEKNREKRVKAKERERIAIAKVIVEKVGALKARLSANPLAPDGFQLSQLIVKYEKVPTGKSVEELKKLRSSLENDLKKLDGASATQKPSGNVLKDMMRGFGDSKNRLKQTQNSSPKTTRKNTEPTFSETKCNKIRGSRYPAKVRVSSSIQVRNLEHGEYFNKGVDAYQNNNFLAVICWWKPLTVGELTSETMVQATHNLATFYDDGSLGTVAKKNPAMAIALWEKSAKRYNVSQFELGKVYENGKGVPVNLVEAAKWYQRASVPSRSDIGREQEFARFAKDKLKLPKFQKVASKTGEDEKILGSRYKQYMTIKECHGLNKRYIQRNEIKNAKLKISNIEKYFKKKNKAMNTDAVWDSASKSWDKEFRSTFQMFKLANQWDKDVSGMCRLQFMGLLAVTIPGAKKKTRKRDF